MRTCRTRERLLEAGLATIRARGFTASGVQDITDAAGVPKGSFYNHFPSKRALGLAALEHYWQAAQPSLAPLHDPGLRVPERIVGHFRAIESELREAGFGHGCLLGNFAIEAGEAGDEIAHRVAAIFATWTELLATCLRDGAAAGDVRSDLEPEDLATLLVSAWQGAVQRVKVEGGPGAFDAFFRTVGRLISA